MTVSAQRDKLNEYIRIADDKKIKAMYVLFKNDIDTDLAWLNNANFVQELDAEYKSWKTGSSKGYTVDEVEETINKLR
jgi:hypothetical protein